MLTTTLREIESHNPCEDGWKKLLTGLGHKDMGAPVPYARILEINGLDDCLWAINKTISEPHRSRIQRLAAVAFVQDVLRLMADERSRNGVRTAHLFAHGEATDEDLASAWASARDAWDAAEDARTAALASARAAVRASAENAACAALTAAEDATWASAENATWAARAAVRAAAKTHQAAWLRAILEHYEEAWGGD